MELSLRIPRVLFMVLSLGKTKGLIYGALIKKDQRSYLWCFHYERPRVLFIVLLLGRPIVLCVLVN